MSDLEALAAELEQVAVKLREGRIDQNEAAALVERLADLAGRVGAELDREARASAPGEPPGQETLL